MPEQSQASDKHKQPSFSWVGIFIDNHDSNIKVLSIIDQVHLTLTYYLQTATFLKPLSKIILLTILLLYSEY